MRIKRFFLILALLTQMCIRDSNNPEPAAQINENVPPDQAPGQILEGKEGKEWTVEQAHQMILEAANRSAMQNALSDAADAVFAWADSGDLTFDSLDGFVQAIAGISDDDDSEVDVYKRQA